MVARVLLHRFVEEMLGFWFVIGTGRPTITARRHVEQSWGSSIPVFGLTAPRTRQIWNRPAGGLLPVTRQPGAETHGAELNTLTVLFVVATIAWRNNTRPGSNERFSIQQHHRHTYERASRETMSRAIKTVTKLLRATEVLERSQAHDWWRGREAGVTASGEHRLTAITGSFDDVIRVVFVHGSHQSTGHFLFTNRCSRSLKVARSMKRLALS